jgi:pimeloyl-ACP methyl ester carboxylesterase
MVDAVPPLEPTPDVIVREDGARIAYFRTQGRTPGVIFLTGYKSDMTGQKALHLERQCRAEGRAFLRFDYFGHGQSSGLFTQGTIGRWADDAAFVLDHLTRGPQVLVGSSLGGWIMTLVARRRPERVAGLLGIAAACDFTRELEENVLTAAHKAALARDGVVPVYSPYDPEPTPVTARILAEARAHLVLDTAIDFSGPVRLIHGLDDPDVPWRTSERLLKALSSTDVELTLIKGAGHRLSEPRDLNRMGTALKSLLARIENQDA